MNVPIPPEFERFARERVAAGAVASEEEAVAVVLRGYLDRVEELRALVDEGIESGPAEPYDPDAIKQAIRDSLAPRAPS